MSTAPFNEKSWATACAAAALRGISLHRSDPRDGCVRVFAALAAKAHLLTDVEVAALLVEHTEAR